MEMEDVRNVIEYLANGEWWEQIADDIFVENCEGRGNEIWNVSDRQEV